MVFFYPKQPRRTTPSSPPNVANDSFVHLYKECKSAGTEGCPVYCLSRGILDPPGMENPAPLLHDSNLRSQCGRNQPAGLLELLAQPEMGGVLLVALDRK